MEFLRRIIQQIKTQLGGLNTSEKMVIFLLLVIFSGAVYWMSQYAAQRRMVPLFTQAVTDDSLKNKIVQKLKSWGEEYSLSNGKIMVPQSRQSELFSLLAYEELLPDSVSDSMEALFEVKPLDTYKVIDLKHKHFTEKRLARVIMGFPGVKEAEVLINASNSGSLINIQPTASASVSITTSGEVTSLKRLASAAATLVSRACNNMKRDKVGVVINGLPIPVAADGEEYGFELFDVKKKVESYFKNKIYEYFSQYNPRIAVNVNFKENTQTETRKILPEGQGSALVTEEKSQNETTSSRAPVSKEPGIVSNVASNTGASASEIQKDTTEETKTKSNFFEGYEHIIKSTHKWSLADISVSLAIPETYFITRAKSQGQNKNNPTPADIKQVETLEIPKIEKQLRTMIGQVDSGSEKFVTVASYPDTFQLVPNDGQGGSGAAPAEAGGTLPNIARKYGKHIAVTALAMLSLFMVLMMVRKASGPIEMSEDEAAVMMSGAKPVDAMSIEDANIIDGEEADGVLEGVELDEAAVRSQQVLQQVRDLVKESPDVAATLIDKWIKEGD